MSDDKNGKILFGKGYGVEEKRFGYYKGKTVDGKTRYEIEKESGMIMTPERLAEIRSYEPEGAAKPMRYNRHKLKQREMDRYSMYLDIAEFTEDQAAMDRVRMTYELGWAGHTKSRRRRTMARRRAWALKNPKAAQEVEDYITELYGGRQGGGGTMSNSRMSDPNRKGQ